MGARPLSPEVWQQRHRIILAVLLAHIPAVVIMAAVKGYPVSHVLEDLVPLVALGFLATFLRQRRWREIAASGGLLVCSAEVVHYGGGLVELHFHFFLSLAMVSLYQSRTILVLAVVFVFVHHWVMGEFWPAAVWSNGANQQNPLEWATLHAVYVLAVGVAQVVFWRSAEQSELRAEASYRLLYKGEQGVVAQLRSAERMKDELVATVSHEFRTPLTSVLGFARMLQEHGTTLTAPERDEYARIIVSQAERLSRLVENLLLTAREIDTSSARCADLGLVAEQVCIELSPLAGTADRITLEAQRDVEAHISDDAAHQILVNLLTNAIKFSPAFTPIDVTVSRDDQGALLEVRNMGGPLADEDLDRVFEPFVQLDSSDTRPAPGVGLGLAIVRRLVIGYGGACGVRNEDASVVFWVRLDDGPNHRAIDLEVDRTMQSTDRDVSA